MTIYIGLVLNKATSDVKTRTPLYQEVTVEVKAFDEASARQAIEAYAKRHETSYQMRRVIRSPGHLKKSLMYQPFLKKTSWMACGIYMPVILKI